MSSETLSQMYSRISGWRRPELRIPVTPSDHVQSSAASRQENEAKSEIIIIWNYHRSTVHSTQTQNIRTSVRELSANSVVNNRIGIRVFRTDWAPTVLVSPQPIKCVAWWCDDLDRWTCDWTVAGSIHGRLGNNSVIRYQSRRGGALRLGR